MTIARATPKAHRESSAAELRATFSTFLDLSAVKKTEMLKQQHESRSRALSESSPDIIYLIDRDGHVVYVNPRAAVYLRRSKTRIIGRHLKDLFPPNAAAQYLRSIRSVVRTGKPFIAPPQRLPNSNLWIETRLIPIRANDGHIESVMGISQDVTRQRHMEEAMKENAELFQLLTTNSFDGINICTYNPSTGQRRLVYCNDRYVKISGYSRKALMQTKNLNTLSTPHGTKSDLKHISRCILNGTPLAGVSSWKRPDGRPNAYEWTAIPYKKDDQLYIVGIDRDITERKQSEEALRQSEEKFSNAFMVSPNMMVISTLRDGRIIDVNITAQRLAGYTRRELVGQRIADLKIWHNMADRRRMLQALRCTGTVHDMEFLFQTKSGTPTWVSMSAVIIDIGNERCVLTIMRDITVQQQAEEALRDSEAMLTKAQKIAHIGSWEMDEASHELRWSDETFRIFGYAPRAFRPTMELFLQGIHPEDRAFMQETIKAAWGSKKLFSENHRIIRQDGTERIVHENGGVIYDNAGQPVKWMGTVQDITERKTEEQAKQKTIDILNETGKLAKVGGWEFDVITGIQTWTDEIYRILEIDLTEDEPLIPDSINLHTPACRPTIKLALQRAIEYGESFDLELEVITNKGNRRWVHTTGKVNQANGKTKSLSGVMQDITVRKHLEMEQKRLPSLILEAQEKERHEISTTLHDHLGQLLSLAKMEAGSIRTQDDKSKLIRNDIVTHLDEALATVRNIAKTLRPPLLDDLGLRIAIETLVEDMAHVFKFRILFKQHGPDPVLSKPHQICLYRVMQEALHNATHHSKGKLILVTLRTETTRVSIQVKDDGKGFDVEKAATGQGIGLKGMRERMRNYGGHFEVQSRPHQGTVLTAVMPCSAPALGISS